jgi:hypothetical protein
LLIKTASAKDNGAFSPSFQPQARTVFGDISLWFGEAGKAGLPLRHNWSARIKPATNEAARKTDQAVNSIAYGAGISLKNQPANPPASKAARIRKARTAGMIIPWRRLRTEEARTIHRGNRMVRNSRYARTSG